MRLKRCLCSSTATIKTIWADGRAVAFHCSDACRDRWIKVETQRSRGHPPIAITSTERDPAGFFDRA